MEKGNWKEEEGSQRHAQVRSQFSKFQISVYLCFEPVYFCFVLVHFCHIEVLQCSAFHCLQLLVAHRPALGPGEKHHVCLFLVF